MSRLKNEERFGRVNSGRKRYGNGVRAAVRADSGCPFLHSFHVCRTQDAKGQNCSNRDKNAKNDGTFYVNGSAHGIEKHLITGLLQYRARNRAFIAQLLNEKNVGVL